MLYKTLFLTLISDKCTDIHGPFFGLGIAIAIIIMLLIDYKTDNK